MPEQPSHKICMTVLKKLALVCLLGLSCAASAQASDATIHPGKYWHELLIAKNFPALEIAIKTLHEQSLQGGEKRRELRRALGYLVNSSARSTPLFDEFANASPNTYGAMTRGYFLVRQGWAARGSKFANETSDEQFARMKQLMLSAERNFESAVKGLNNRCDPCYSGMVNIGMATSNVELKTRAINASARYDEGGFEAPLAYVESLGPRWGGSAAGVQQYVDDFVAQFPQSFTSKLLKTVLLINKADAYLRAGEDDRAQFLAEQVSKIDPGSSNALRVQTTVALNKKDYEKVIELASRALVIDPDLTSTRNARAHAYMLGKTPLAAVPDLEFTVAQGDEWALAAVLPIVASGKYGFTPDRQRAKAICQSALDALLASGFTCMGGLYYFGFNGSPDHTEARRWFTEGAQRGNPSALVDVGVMLWRGQGGARQPDEAVKYWRMGKAVGEPRAEQQLRANLSQIDYFSKVTWPEIRESMTFYLDELTQDWQNRLRALLYSLTGR